MGGAIGSDHLRCWGGGMGTNAMREPSKPNKPRVSQATTTYALHMPPPKNNHHSTEWGGGGGAPLDHVIEVCGSACVGGVPTPCEVILKQRVSCDDHTCTLASLPHRNAKHQSAVRYALKSTVSHHPEHGCVERMSCHHEGPYAPGRDTEMRTRP